MELRQLRYFLAVAEHLHFTDAAEYLGIAQPPLSQQILKLEREIGTPLFIRFPRRVVLTPAGEIFRQSAQQILNGMEQALVQIKQVARGENGRLSVGFAGSVVFHSRIATVMREFRQRFPEVLITSQESNSVTLLQKLQDLEVDCAFIRTPLNCQPLTSFSLVKEPMMAVLPAGHALEQQPSITLAALAADPLIMFPRAIGPQLYDAILAACQQAGFTPRISMESPQISSTVNMVAAGFGVTLVPESICHIHAPGVSYHNLCEPAFSSDIALVFRPRERSAVVQNFVHGVQNS